MLRWSANLTFLFKEHAFIDRFEAASKAGNDPKAVMDALKASTAKYKAAL